MRILPLLSNFFETTQSRSLSPFVVQFLQFCFFIFTSFLVFEFLFLLQFLYINMKKWLKNQSYPHILALYVVV